MNALTLYDIPVSDSGHASCHVVHTATTAQTGYGGISEQRCLRSTTATVSSLRSGGSI